MCGIIGYQGKFGEQALRAGMHAIAHRGPDDSGLFVDESHGVGLGHLRLSIIDLSPLGHQPMQDDAGTVQLIFNGEIYNYRELRAELQSRGCRFRGHSDTEVILQLYLAQGTDMLARLNGIFTIALWDTRTSTLLVARDALGVKPLYVSESARGLAFSSEIKGLLHLVPEARQLDHAALHRYLSFLWCPGEGTPLTGVRKLLPGEAMEVREGKVSRRWTWYRLPVFRGVHGDLSERESIEGTVSHLRSAVERQLVADVPVGAFLSGGLDSSAIVAFARESTPGMRCFTIEADGGQEEGATDDLPYARRVADHLGVKLDVVRIDAGRMALDLERMIVQLDEPLADPAPLNVLYISELARQHGMKVLLSGAGGDDLFTGYRRHRALNMEGMWSWLPRSARHALDQGTRMLDQRRAWSRRLAKLFSGAGLERDQRIANYFAWAREADLLSLYTRDFREHLGSTIAAAPMTDFLAPLSADVPPLDRMLALEQRFFLADHNLTYTDKMSMAVGVEVRVPFLDLELVDFAARIPLGLKQRGKVGKWVLKRAMEPYLPHDV
ncbi:MAG: asparagine synthase (glutamine-hydrolyzing), partial [Phycisphaerae bacterium]|nr:asparagine synthase (glutamine-hydrolyzing) [Phycisphaerae bacterium]